MTPEDFNKMLGNRMTSMRKVLETKASEYGLLGDRHHNFKVAARFKNETPERALWGIAVKQLVSVVDMIEGNLRPTEKLVDEKIGDMVNYLVLLEGLLREKLEPPEQVVDFDEAPKKNGTE